MTTLKPSENKREEFRKYLERTGVMDALTKVLVSLYEESEKPDDALDYIRNKLTAQDSGDNIETLKIRLEEANLRISLLEQENAELRGESPRTDEPGDLPPPPPPPLPMQPQEQ